MQNNFGNNESFEDGELNDEDLDQINGGVNNKGLDSSGDLDGSTSLRLQKAMDRNSKFMSTLSDIEKKASDTDAAIFGNK